jgi:hypothetical protein
MLKQIFVAGGLLLFASAACRAQEHVVISGAVCSDAESVAPLMHLLVKYDGKEPVVMAAATERGLNCMYGDMILNGPGKPTKATFIADDNQEYTILEYAWGPVSVYGAILSSAVSPGAKEGSYIPKVK